jgi:hypothetical protein
MGEKSVLERHLWYSLGVQETRLQSGAIVLMMPVKEVDGPLCVLSRFFYHYQIISIQGLISSLQGENFTKCVAQYWFV